MDGIVKFNCHWSQSGPVIADEQYEIINYWREILFNMDLIGAYENGVGFGNISLRIRGGNQFFITGSATGEIPELEPGHYVKVNSFNIDDNAVKCTGPLKASSESLTHAAIYLSDPDTNAVIHVHSIELWNELIHNVPTTNPSMDYGTACLAKDILRLFRESDVFEKRIIVMAGDRAGILTFGHDMDEAANVLMQYLRKGQ
jgi:L-ribulose-5-phosphate 4-epimerase